MQNNSHEDANERIASGSSSDQTPEQRYRFVPTDPRWRLLRIDAAHPRLVESRRPLSDTVEDSADRFVNSTLYLG